MSRYTEEERAEYRDRARKRKLARAEKMTKICEMVAARMSWIAIAQALGYKNHTTPLRLWERYVASVPRKLVEDSRIRYELTTSRALRVAIGIMLDTQREPKVRLDACRTVNQISRDQAVVLGFAAPVQHRVGGAVNAPPIAVQTSAVEYGEVAGLDDEQLNEARAAVSAAIEAATRSVALAATGSGDRAPAASESEPG